MQFGYQTIVFGTRLADVGRMLDVIADAGFRGIEVFQPPSELPKNPNDFLAMLRPRGLSLLGLTGGTLTDRVDYLRSATFLPQEVKPYLYVDNWGVKAKQYYTEGFQLAVHPHYLKQVEDHDHALRLLQDHDKLKYLPDCAHSAIISDPFQKQLLQFEKRLAAVHIKDWHPGFGRSSPLYARGFCELGKGRANVAAVLEYLQKNLRFSGWVIVELDYAEGIPEEAVYNAAAWLQSQGYPIDPKRKLKAEAQKYPGLEGSAREIHYELLDKTVRISSQKLSTSYEEFAQVLKEALRAEAITWWSCSELEKGMTVLGRFPVIETNLEMMAASIDDDLDFLEPKLIQLRNSNGLDQISQRFRETHSEWKRLRVPVVSSWNPNQLRFVLDLFGSSIPDLPSLAWGRIQRAIARFSDNLFGDIALLASAKVGEAASHSTAIDDFAELLCAVLAESLDCATAVLFLPDESGTRLYPCPKDTPRLKWRDGIEEWERFYEKGDGQFTTNVWQDPTLRPVFLHRYKRTELNKDTKAHLVVEDYPKPPVLMMPIVDTDRNCIGLVKCAGRRTRGEQTHFSDEDLALLDHMIQVAIPHLVRFQEEEKRRWQILKVTHELKRPVNSLRTLTKNLKWEFNDRIREGIRPLEHDYIGDAESWTELMRGLMRRSEYFTAKPKELIPKREAVSLVRDIVAPVVRQLRMELREEGLPEDFDFPNLRFLPKITVDRNMFQQVFFNLLDNAIKYRSPDSTSLGVTIDAWHIGGDLEIRVANKGIGIKENMRKSIFDLGVRAPDAHYYKVQGTGIGLWLVRKLIELHEGAKIEVTNLSDPTTFAIHVPKAVLRRDR